MTDTSRKPVEERRRVQRTRALKAARIIFNRRSSVMSCTVHNLTNLGACLHVANSLGVPQAFELAFGPIRSARTCRVIWRTATELGVEFV